MQYLDPRIQFEIDEGYITARPHPSLDLYVLNYSSSVSYKRRWNEATLQCRGLIVDKQGRVVSRPFSKFFNLGEHVSPDLPDVPFGESFVAYEKMDGCCDGDTLIQTETGSKTIREICDTKWEGNVTTLNTETDQFEMKPIIGHSVLRNNHDWYEIETETGEKLILTGNHKIWLPGLCCYRRVDELVGNESVKLGM